MSYQDFDAADAVYAPVDDGLMLGLPPLMLALLFVLLLAAALLGWWYGQRDTRSGESDGPAIWKAIDEAIRAAMTAHSDAVWDKAATLRNVIKDRLGKTLALAGGLKGWKALEEALEDADGHGDDHGHGGGHAGHDDHGHNAGHEEDHDDHAEADAAGSVFIERARQVIINAPNRDRPRDSHRPAPPTPAERRDRLRKAVADLNDHWRLKDQRVREIDAAYRELSAPRSKR